MGSGGNFVPQLGPFASTLDSTRRKGTQTNQNIKKLESLLIIVVEAHKRAALHAAMALAIIFFASLLRPAVGQTNFGGGSQNSNPSSDVNTRLFTGNQALDSRLVGIGLGALGATVLAPAVGNALNGGGNSGFNNGFNNNGNNYNACGKRRKRQVDGQTRFFLPNGGSCTCGKRKKRQAQSRIFFGGNNNNCGSCCYNNGYANGFNN